ncbi:uncharacterized protein LACBIDRAFT_227995 [Laccaria bicolor S238N-H82]|uniref:Conserved oligomeric Golgi complex subunit 8 n=1 Tax=Laccaria bicolor (strain S238N-H82 / ATCC MYA-4686) TaxID=486041 RepID=B0CNJ2_LACBS|nr:uncharacterized protein LACBIDRAFT_227995 [Laccaria bicolor S238N-H82]EDR15937.1 predicted protein [Laccaria bicolor S238N-H82]|eukprot:XP_001874145.1 predicted protein [Laccaria bicolor S238N-H82]
MQSPIPVSTTTDTSSLADVLASSSKTPPASLTTPLSQEYLSRLTTLPLTDLLVEPTALQTQSHHLTSSITSLTHTSYPTFLSLHRTTTALTTSLDSLSSSLDALLNTSLPALEETAAGWKERTDAVLKERGKAKVVLEQHEKIRELLEIPLLIDACVRNGYFSEALSLASHAKAPGSSSDKSLILRSILSEVHHSVLQMLLSLIATLYEPNRKLPALWKAVNFLRKMDAFTPQSPFASPSSGNDINRLTKDGELEEREKEDLARYLKKYIDIWREGVYDIITQYSTIFLERSSSSNLNSQHLATTYASRALTTHLLLMLSPSLPLLSLSLLPSLLTQLTYCSTAFARVGLDFRGILSLLFGHAVTEVVGHDLRTAGDNTTRTLSPNDRDRTTPIPPSKWLITPSLLSSPPAPSLPSGPPHIPPQVLTSYPPLAEHTNAILGVLNSLRLLAPQSILPELLSSLDDVLTEGGDVLMKYIKSLCSSYRGTGSDDQETRREQEKKAARAAGEMYFAVFVPFLRRALVEGVYGGKVEDLDGELGGKVAGVVKRWEDWVQEEREQGNT